MLIGIISDTHLRRGQTLPAKAWEELSKVDLILHAGDITNQNLLDDLSSLAKVEAVQGNCDGWELNGLLKKRFLNVKEKESV